MTKLCRSSMTENRIWAFQLENDELNHNLCSHYLCAGEFVAQFKFTVLLMANGPLRITNSLFEPELYKSELDVEDAELKVKCQLDVVFFPLMNLNLFYLHRRRILAKSEAK